MSGGTVVYLGASRGVGFTAYAKLAHARKDIQSVLLLPSVSSFKESEPQWTALDDDVKSRTTLVEGSAHSEDSVRVLLHAAGPNPEAIVFSIGFAPDGFLDTMKMIASGFKNSPPELCSRGMTVLLKVLSENYPGYNPKPKLVVISSAGIGKEALKVAPFTLRILCKITPPRGYNDRLAMEVSLANALFPPHATSSPLPRFFPSPSEVSPHILAPETLAALPSGFIDPVDVCVLRPAFFTDGPARGITKVRGDGGYRLRQEGKESEGMGMSAISRTDVGGFVAALLRSGDDDEEGAAAKKWWGHQVVLAY